MVPILCHFYQVYRVYHAMRESGADFIVPPPPVLDNPNVRHGVIDRPDQHRVDDRARLLAQIEMDQGRRALILESHFSRHFA